MQKLRKQREKKSAPEKERVGTKSNQVFYAPLRRARASDSVGRAGIAPFLVVVMAPHAFANLSTPLNLCSSCNQANRYLGSDDNVEV
jgi:hypothetical protein